MTVGENVLAHLRFELSRNDPWDLDANAFEQARFAVLDKWLHTLGMVDRALEIGCASGAFTRRLVRHCELLDVLDAMPEALERCRARVTASENVRYWEGDIAGDLPAPLGSYDLVVVTEVLYYLEVRKELEAAVANIVDRVRPGGVVIFGSALDRVTARWGLQFGAESAHALFERTLVEEERRICTGSTPDENALLLRYRRHG